MAAVFCGKQDIEAARRKLNEAVGRGYNDQVYRLSLELDRLIEIYVDMRENEDSSVT